MVTIYDIAKKCQVSPSTVSKVINNYSSIPEATKRKVLEAMEEMNFVPSQTASNLSTGSSKTVGVLAYMRFDSSPLKHPLFTDILENFQRAINKKGYDILLISKNIDTNDKKSSFYKNCLARRLDGVLLFGDMSTPEMMEIIQSDIPTIGLDYSGEKITGVSSNNYELMFSLTKHLLELGHRNIAIIHGEQSKITLSRIKGYIDALNSEGIKTSEENMIESHYMDSDTTNELVLKLLQSDNPPTAIMCPDDFSACRVVNFLKKHGIKCPRDVSITGFDGIELGQLITPRLTTAMQDCAKIGEVLADEMLNLIKRKRKSQKQIIVPGKIIFGDSTGPSKDKLD